jgi:hypothetical protein
VSNPNVAMTRIGVAAICSVLLTPGSWVGQDPTARVLTSKDIRAEIGTDTDTGSVMAQVLTHLMVNHERREFFLGARYAPNGCRQPLASSSCVLLTPKLWDTSRLAGCTGWWRRLNALTTLCR